MREIPADVMDQAREAVALEYEVNDKTSAGATLARLGGMDTKTAVRAAARAIMTERERCAKDTERLDWLESKHTLHGAVKFLYVVDGYQAELTYDYDPISPAYHGESLRDTIDAIRGHYP